MFKIKDISGDDLTGIMLNINWGADRLSERIRFYLCYYSKSAAIQFERSFIVSAVCDEAEKDEKPYIITISDRYSRGRALGGIETTFLYDASADLDKVVEALEYYLSIDPFPNPTSPATRGVGADEIKLKRYFVFDTGITRIVPIKASELFSKEVEILSRVGFNKITTVGNMLLASYQPSDSQE